MQTHITYGAIFLAIAQLPFLLNLVRSFRNGRLAGENPWAATTMEWKPGLFLAGETPAEETISVFREPCDYRDGNKAATFHPQWVSESLAE